MTPEQRARDVRARKLEAAGFAEVNGELVKRDKAVQMVREAREAGEHIDFSALRKVDLDALPDDDDETYFSAQERELAEELWGYGDDEA